MNKNHPAYSHPSQIGTFVIRFDGRQWRIQINGEDLGGYSSPQQAIDDLVGGHCDWPTSGDPSLLGLADELGDWQPSR